MNRKTIITAVLSLALLAGGALVAATPTLAVDATITPYCRGEAAKVHANFCAAVANNKSMVSQVGSFSCPAGQVEDPPHSRECVPAAL